MVPSLKSLFYLTLSSFLQFLGLIIGLVTVIQVLNVEKMYLYEYDYLVNSSVKVDITLYIQIITCITLFFHAMGFLLALVNCMLAYRGLSNLNNRIDRRSQIKHQTEFSTTLPEAMFKKEANFFRG